MLGVVGSIARGRATFHRQCLVETKRLSDRILNQNLDTGTCFPEYLFHTYIGSADNHRRIDALLVPLAAARCPG